MRAAIYARRSTEEHQEQSLRVQVDEARRYIEGKGWTVEGAQIYREDGVSRSEFKKRPALTALLLAAEKGAFDVVIVRDETRLGGDTYRTGLLIQELIESGVELHYYFTDERVRIDGAIDKFLVTARNFAAELEREKISQRTREHLLSKARQGLNTGGRVYGYDNVVCEDGGRRVEFRINEVQAKVVLRIFERYADGHGLARIAKALNADGIPPPRAGKRGTGSWSPSGVRVMLHNERYRGVLVWGRYEKAYRGGTKVRLKKPESEWIRVELPELAIVDHGLWTRTVARRTKNQRAFGQNERQGPPHRHLLTSIARCGECGGPITTKRARYGDDLEHLYLCGHNWKRGRTVCSNTIRRPVDRIDQAVIGWIQENVLKDEVVDAAIVELRKRLAARARTSKPELAAKRAEQVALKTQLDNLVTAIATMGHSAALAERLGFVEARLADLNKEVELATTTPAEILAESKRAEAEARQRMKHFRDLLGRNPMQARQVVETLVDGQLRLTPVGTERGRRIRIEGRIYGDALYTKPNVPKGI